MNVEGLLVCCPGPVARDPNPIFWICNCFHLDSNFSEAHTPVRFVPDSNIDPAVVVEVHETAAPGHGFCLASRRTELLITLGMCFSWKAIATAGADWDCHCW